MAVYQGSLTVKRRPKDGVPGNPGIPGLPGQVPIQKEWVVGDTHRFNDEIKDFIYVRGASSDTSYWYTRTSKGDDIVADAAPVGGAKVEGYTRVDWLRTLAVNVLLAEEANLANFVFKDGKLLSIAGTVNGVPATYTGQAGFVPNITLDGQTGAAYFGANKIMFNPDGSGHLADGDISWAPGEPTRFRGVIELLSSLGKVGVIDSGLVTSGGQISEDILETLTQLAAGYSVSITPQSSWTDSYLAGQLGEYAHAYTQNIVVTEDSSLEFWVSFGKTYSGWNETYDVYVEDVNTGVLEYTRRKFSSTISFAGGNYSIPVRAGTYKIHAKITGTGGSQLNQVLSVTLKGKNEATNITAVGFKQKTKIGADGFYSYWGADKYIYYRKGADGQPAEFYIKGLPTSPTGLPSGSGRVWRDSDGTLKSV